MSSEDQKAEYASHRWSESSDEGDLTCQKCQVNELLAAKFSQKGSLFEKFKTATKGFHDL